MHACCYAGEVPQQRCQTNQLTPVSLCVGWHLASYRCLQGMLPQSCRGLMCCWTAGSRAAQSACCSCQAATSSKPTVRSSSSSNKARAAQALTASRAKARTDPMEAAVLGVVLVQRSGCCGWFQQGTLTTRCWCLGAPCCVLLCAAWQSAGVHCAAAVVVDGPDCVTATKQAVHRLLQQVQSLWSLTRVQCNHMPVVCVVCSSCRGWTGGTQTQPCCLLQFSHQPSIVQLSVSLSQFSTTTLTRCCFPFRLTAAAAAARVSWL